MQACIKKQMCQSYSTLAGYYVEAGVENEVEKISNLFDIAFLVLVVSNTLVQVSS